MIRNVLVSIRQCLESAKYTGVYNSQVCKELMSKYVCSLANDAIMYFISDCTPFGMKRLDKSAEPGFTEYMSGGLKGVFDGVGGAVSDFNKDYDNAAMKELMGDGGSSLGQKACMAALGYGWDFDINHIVDAAYQTEFETNIVAPVTRRSYMYTNPTTGKPVFEYRGGVYIMPGCQIESYSVSLVCVTKADQMAKNGIQDETMLSKGLGLRKGIDCTGPDKCPCLNVPTGRQPAPYTVKMSGGRLTQGVPEDRAFHEVTDNSAYLYDHIRVELFMQEDKKTSCLADGYKDGVFYFPINDHTPVTTYGCEINYQTGALVCTRGLATKLGFGNLIIHDVEMNEKAAVGQTFKAAPIITKTGTDKVCLTYKLYKGDPDAGGTPNGGETTIPITEVYTNQKMTEYNVFGTNPTVPQDIVGAGAQIIKFEIKAQSSGEILTGFTSSYAEIPSSKSGSLIVYFKTTNTNGIFQCNDGGKTTYTIDPSKEYKSFDNCVITDGNGVSVKIDSIKTPENRKNIDSLSLTFQVNSPQTAASSVQMWYVAEGSVPTKDGSCIGGTKIPAATFKKPFLIVREITAFGEGPACKDDGLTLCPETGCSCGNTIYINCGKEGTSGKYCYKDPAYPNVEAKPLPVQSVLAQGQTQSQLAAQFGQLRLWNLQGGEGSTVSNQVTTLRYNVNSKGVVVYPDTNYALTIDTPKKKEDIKFEVTYNKANTETVISGGKVGVDFKYDESSLAYKRDFQLVANNDMPTGFFYDIKVLIIDQAGNLIATKGPMQIYFASTGESITSNENSQTTGGVGLNGVCGNNNEGKCQNTKCGGLDNSNMINSNTITDAVKRCSGILVCCKN